MTRTKAIRLERLIVKPFRKSIRVLKHHERVKRLPTQFFLSTKENCPESVFYAATRFVSGRKERHVKLHYHTKPSAYVFIGCGESLKGLRVKLFLEDKQFVVRSPCFVYLPPGVKHAHQYLGGKGHFLKILLSQGKSYNDLTF